MNRYRWVLALLLLLQIITACANRIVRSDCDQGTHSEILLVDYGYGSNLALPLGDEFGAVVYSYGEWKWFAQSRDSWWRVFPVLFLPTQGTLGRKVILGPEALSRYARSFDPSKVWRIAVPESRVAELRKRLDNDYEKARLQTGSVYNPLYDLYFVKWGARYSVLHNCNHVTVEWLRELGLHFKSTSPFSIWSVEACQ